MKTLQLGNATIYYKIVYKKNKNTYFYVRDNNVLDIKASNRQTESQILQYIQDNQERFLRKMNRLSFVIRHDKEYFLFGKTYQRIQSLDTNKLQFDHQLHRVYEPKGSVDQLHILYQQFEKKVLLQEVAKLHQKYQDNPFINIDNLTYKTRYTKTRYGSCNPIKRTINFNLHLTKIDPIFLEYVYLHEICHLKYQHHQTSFYKLLEQLMPNYKSIRKELKQFSLR